MALNRNYKVKEEKLAIDDRGLLLDYYKLLQVRQKKFLNENKLLNSVFTEYCRRKKEQEAFFKPGVHRQYLDKKEYDATLKNIIYLDKDCQDFVRNSREEKKIVESERDEIIGCRNEAKNGE
jgi:hypothetical protein